MTLFGCSQIKCDSCENREGATLHCIQTSSSSSSLSEICVQFRFGFCGVLRCFTVWHKFTVFHGVSCCSVPSSRCSTVFRMHCSSWTLLFEFLIQRVLCEQCLTACMRCSDHHVHELRPHWWRGSEGAPVGCPGHGDGLGWLRVYTVRRSAVCHAVSGDWAVYLQSHRSIMSGNQTGCSLS